MAEKIYVHLAQSINYDLKFTKENAGNPHAAPTWEDIKETDAKSDGTGSSVKPIERYKKNGNGANTGRGKESIQIILSKTAGGAGKFASAVVNLFGVRGGGAFKSKRPTKGGGALGQRLIAKFVVTNGIIDFQKSVFRESLTPRKNRPQQNHRPKDSDSKRIKVFTTSHSAAISKPGPVPKGTQPAVVNEKRTSIILDLGGFRLAFSPEAIT